MPDSILDSQAIENLRSLSPGDDSLLRELVELFVRDTPQHLAAIETAGDATRAARAAHSIKGSAGNFGATQLSAVAAQVERLCKEGKLAEGVAALPALKAEFARVKAALESLLAGT